jgi:hypothetical protein
LARIQLVSARSCTHCERPGSTTYNNNYNSNTYSTFHNTGTSFAVSMGARLFLRMHFIFIASMGYRTMRENHLQAAIVALVGIDVLVLAHGLSLLLK